MQTVKEAADAAMVPLYLARGRRPWSPGYNTVKRRAICGALDTGMPAPSRPLPAGYWFPIDERIVKYPWVYARLPKGRATILDAGPTLNYAFLLERPPVRDAELTICTLAPKKRCYWQRSIALVFDDPRASRLRDTSFDAVVSISTIEHIGLDNTLLYTSDPSKHEADHGGFIEAVPEFRRVLKPGVTCLITVPFGRAQNHGWFHVFDLPMIESIVAAFPARAHEARFFGYAPDGWHEGRPENLAEATCFEIHAQKHYDPDSAAFSRGVACLRRTP